MKKINYLLARGSADDRKRSDRPPTTATAAYQKVVLNEIQLKTKASIRNVSAKIKRKGFQTSLSSVYRTTKLAELKWFKKIKKLEVESDS